MTKTRIHNLCYFSKLKKNELMAKGLTVTTSQERRLRSKLAGNALRSVMLDLIEKNESLIKEIANAIHNF